MKTKDRLPSPASASLARVPDITLLDLEEIIDLYDVPYETAVLLKDETLIDDQVISDLSGRQMQTVRKWRTTRTADLKAHRDPDVNPNALISAEPKRPGSSEPVKLGRSLGFKYGRVLHWLIITLRYDAYKREAVHHKGYGRQVGSGKTDQAE